MKLSLRTVTLIALASSSVALLGQEQRFQQPAPSARPDSRRDLEWNLEPLTILATDGPVIRLQKQRRNNAARWARSVFHQYESDWVSFDRYLSTLQVLAQAESALANTPELQLALLRRRLAIALAVEEINNANLAAERGDRAKSLADLVARLEIQIELQQRVQWHQSEPLRIDEAEEEIHKVLKEKHNNALAKLQLYFQQYQAREIKVVPVLESASQMALTLQDIFGHNEDRVARKEQYRDFCRMLESIAKERFEKKLGPHTDWLEAKHYRLTAEFDLIQARAFGDSIPFDPDMPLPAERDPAENSDLSLEQVITRSNGSFKRNGPSNAPIIEVEFISGGETNATFKRLAEINTIRSLYSTGAGVTDEGLQHLRVQSDLESLVLNSPNITDAGTKEFAALPRLKRLSLGGTSLTDAGLREIGQLKQLEKLTLPGENITDDGIKHLANLTNLRELQVNGSKVTNAGLKDIGKMKALSELGLLGTFITDEGLQELRELKNLRLLYLSGSAIRDAGLKDLKSLELHSLWLSGTLVSDAGLEELAQIKTLQDLQLIGTKVTEAGVAKFREGSPRCVVTLKPFVQ
jgi:hypothetical protein